MAVSTRVLLAIVAVFASMLVAAECSITIGDKTPTPTPTAVATPRPTPTPVTYPPECGRLCRPDFWESADVSDVETELELGADINGSKGSGLNSPLHRAIEHNAGAAVVELMLQRGADPNASGYAFVLRSPGLDPRSHRTPLQLAADLPDRSPAVVQLLLEYGADPNPPTDHDQDDESPLYYAGRLHYSSPRAIIELLLEHGADVNSRSYGGLTPLHRVVYEADPTLIELLLGHGADIHARTYANNFKFGGRSVTPLHIAAESNPKSRSIATLLDRGADVNAKAHGGETPLHMALSFNHAGIVALLLDRGADVNARDGDGETPLHWAIRRTRDPTVIPLLLDHGADANAKTEDGFTPLHMAVEQNGLELAALLLDHGADVNAKSHNRRSSSGDHATPLHWAAFYDSGSDVAELLISRGADLNAEDQDGRTPCQIAKEHDKPTNFRRLVCR